MNLLAERRSRKKKLLRSPLHSRLFLGVNQPLYYRQSSLTTSVQDAGSPAQTVQAHLFWQNSTQGGEETRQGHPLRASQDTAAQQVRERPIARLCTGQDAQPQ